LPSGDGRHCVGAMYGGASGMSGGHSSGVIGGGG
jgi:hypothetical protein